MNGFTHPGTLWHAWPLQTRLVSHLTSDALAVSFMQVDFIISPSIITSGPSFQALSRPGFYLLTSTRFLPVDFEVLVRKLFAWCSFKASPTGMIVYCAVPPCARCFVIIAE